jgi:hypothetical protein
MNAVQNQIGEMPNTAVIPDKVWRFFKNHPKIKAYLALGVEQVITLELFAKFLELDKIMIGRARKITDPKAAVKVQAPVWGNGIWVGYIAPPQGIDASPYNPAFGYTLQLSGNPYVDEYDVNNGKGKGYRATDNFDIKIVGADAGFYLKNPINPSNF